MTRLVWLDLETTGLDPVQDEVLEIAMVVTDVHLEEVAHYTQVNEASGLALERMTDHVRAMHTDSRLLQASADYGLDYHPFQDQAVAFLDSVIPAGEKPPMCGNTIGFDRSFLRAWYHDLHQKFHYRSVDVSTIKILFHLWNPKAQEFPKKKAHRALDDVRESLAEIRYYRAKGFIDPGYYDRVQS